jgi:hypothetical protein
MHNRPTTRLAVALLTIPIMYGCSTGTGRGNNDADQDEVTQNDEDIGDSSGGRTGNTIDDEAADVLDELLDAEADPADALRILSDDMADTPGVRGVLLSDDESELWVVYDSGEQVLFSVETFDDTFTDATDLGGVEDEDDFIDAAKIAAPMRTQPRQNTGDLIPGLTTSAYVLPDSNRALLINSIAACAGDKYEKRDYDSTKGIDLFLQRIGYASDKSEGSLDAFKVLTDYGVIFIEARTSGEKDEEVFAQMLQSGDTTESGEEPANADPYGNGEIVVTSTIVTPALREQYADDLHWGRLKIRRAHYKRHGETTKCDPTFAVTPNFIRQHAPGRFPNHTLLYISAGGVYDETAVTSEWQKLLEERSDNGHFVTWGGKPKYVVSKLAAANFFELMTGAQFKYKIIGDTLSLPDESPGGTVELNTAQVLPPMVNQGMGNTLAALNTNGDAIDFNTGAFLVHLPSGPQALTHQLALAPVFNDFFIDQLSRVVLLGGGPAGTEARFTDANLNYDIGEHGLPELDNAGIVFAGTSGYHFDISTEAGGALRLQELLDRTSSSRTVYTWKPTFVVTGEGAVGEEYTMTFELVVRAIPAPRYRGTVNPLDFFSAPKTNAFSGRCDGATSTVFYSVTGRRTSGTFTYEYSGVGLSPLNFKDEDGWPTDAIFSTVETEGESVTVDLDYQADLFFTQTSTDSDTGQVVVTQRTLPNPLMFLTGLRIDDKLTLKAGSESISSSDAGWTATVTWEDAAPSPAFSIFRAR